MEPGTSASDTNLSNWRKSSHNHFAFHHLPSEIETARIPAGKNGDVFPLSAKSIEAFSLRLPSGSSIDLEQVLAETSTDAMIVLHKGQMVFETYRNAMNSTSRHIAMSATKAVIGLLTEILAADGAIKLDMPIQIYVPEIASSPFANVSARDLLDMRVAVALDPVQETLYAQSVGWEPHGATKIGIKSFFSQLRGRAWQSGGAFLYHSANTDLLGWALERATSRTVQDLISEKIWIPIAQEDAALTLDWDGFARSAGGLCATIRDLARLGHALSLDGTLGNQRQVLPSGIVSGLANGGDRQAWSSGQWGGPFSPISPKMSYRSGWFTVDGDAQILFAMGVYGQNLFIDRKNKTVMAKFSSWPDAVDGRKMWLTHAAFDEVRRCLEAA